MEPSKHVTVRVDLARVRRNAERVARETGVALIAVVKADAYGLGAAAVAGVLGDLVDAFYVFNTWEAVAADLWRLTGKRTIALQGDSTNADDYRSAGIVPVVWTTERAVSLRSARPVVSIDTGQQRFAVAADRAAAVARACDARELMTHATRPEQIAPFHAVVEALPDAGANRFLHAAGSALLGDPAARLDAVRPGLALYDRAVRVTARLVEARDSVGPAGYTGFESPRFGVVLAGYRNGWKTGPCRVNGTDRRIIEVGMQSAFVELGAGDRVGDEVVLLGDDGPAVSAVADGWGTSRQEVLVRACGSGVRNWV